MSARPSWDGFLKFNLISVPVKAYSVTISGGGKIGFHLIHKKCNSRIHYKKVCPIHGEVGNDEIVSAYEYAKGEYIIVDPDERKRLRVENDKAIDIDAFVTPDAVDPVYFTERTYYLVPDGKVAQKPYAVIREAMERDNRYAIAQIVFTGQGRVCLVRPVGKLLTMTLLSYKDQIKKPAAFESELTEQSVSAEERKLAEMLIEAATAKHFDLGKYKDEYTAKLVKLLEAKSKGRKKIVTAPVEEAPAVINLMDALRKSLKQAQAGGDKKSTKKARPESKQSRAPARRKTG